MYTESVLPEEQTVSEILWRIGDQAVPYRELPERSRVRLSTWSHYICIKPQSSVFPEEQMVSGFLCAELASRLYPIGNFLNGVRAPSVFVLSNITEGTRDSTKEENALQLQIEWKIVSFCFCYRSKKKISYSKTCTTVIRSNQEFGQERNNLSTRNQF
ncbi:hypothetical protein OUZ56_027712 [Daphnia magna]|uniref:Uncharacterized protein n=1 Tax=Daphnia magna TaxID=35525 RepID=A0ABR0B1U3_9CRUS|nr:hypothetical protein OUZ56_027712 [Daphnia magna]